MGTVAEFKVVGDDSSSSAYSNGVADGQTARAESSSLTPHLQVGIDDYAKGFRAGFFGQILADGSIQRQGTTR